MGPKSGAAPRGEISSEAFDIFLLVAYDFAMPTVLRIGPYRFFFYASDRDEPMHIHVERDKAVAKLWLAPVRLQHSTGFSRSELVEIEALVADKREMLSEAWNDFFTN